MRLHAALLLTALLAFGAFATDSEGHYSVPAIGRESCDRSVAEAGVDRWVGELVQITCDLDDAMLWVQKYYDADPADRFMGKLRADRLKSRSQHR